MLAQRDLDLHAGIGQAPEHLDHPGDRFVLRRRLLHDLDDHHLACLGLAARVGGHQHVLVDAPVLGHDEKHAVLFVEPPDHLAGAALEHVDDLPLRAAAAIHAGDARGGTIAVQQLVHLLRRKKEIGAAVVRPQEAIAVRMPLDRAAHEIELGEHAKLALAIHQELAVALHCPDAAGKGLAGALLDVERTRELRFGHRRALQRVEDGAARRDELWLDVGSLGCAPCACCRGIAALAGGTGFDSLF